MNRNPLPRTISIALLAAVTLGACGSDEPADSDAPAPADTSAPATDDQVDETGPTISEAWSREPVDGQTASAVYGIIQNPGADPITAVSVTSSVTDMAQLHEVVMNDDGTMTMQEREDGIEIPAGGSVTLEPGSFHVMLMGIDPATYPDTIDVEITFDDGSTLAFDAPVRAIDNGDMEMDMDGDMEMDGDDMDGEMDMDMTATTDGA